MLTDTVKEYRNIVENLDKLIKASGYRTAYIYEQMGMDKTAFYYRRKKRLFTIDEVEKLLSIIRADELEDKGLLDLNL